MNSRHILDALDTADEQILADVHEFVEMLKGAGCLE